MGINNITFQNAIAIDLKERIIDIDSIDVETKVGQ
jgi:hypothetical protein